MSKPEENAVVEEISIDVFEHMTEGGGRSLIDWAAIWKAVEGKIISRARFEEIANEIRGQPGKELHWSQFSSALKRWRAEGKEITERWGTVGNKRKKFFKFGSK